MGNEWKFNWGVFGVVFYFGLCAIFPPLILPLLLAIIYGCFMDAFSYKMTDEERAELRKKELEQRAKQREINRKSDENFLKYEAIRKNYEAECRGETPGQETKIVQDANGKNKETNIPRKTKHDFVELWSKEDYAKHLMARAGISTNKKK